MAEDKKYEIKVDRKTTFTVLEHQLFRPRWIEYFGGLEEVEKFIKDNK